MHEPARTCAKLGGPSLARRGGDGLAGTFGALEAGGFDGWYDLEIFSDDGTFGADYPDSLWKFDPLEMVRRAKR